MQEEAGRLWFARFVNAQRVQGRRVTEATFFSLAQFFAIVLFECADSDDFAPAKSLMNMCFTFYYEGNILFHNNSAFVSADFLRSYKYIYTNYLLFIPTVRYIKKHNKKGLLLLERACEDNDLAGKHLQLLYILLFTNSRKFLEFFLVF